LVWRHSRLVFRACRSILRDHHAAEDATQAVFLALARQASTVGRRGNPSAWPAGLRPGASATGGTFRPRYPSTSINFPPTRRPNRTAISTG
jgi:hypothetical protein